MLQKGKVWDHWIQLETSISQNESSYYNLSDENSSNIEDSISLPTSNNPQKIQINFIHLCANVHKLAKTTKKDNFRQVNQINNLKLKTKQVVIDNYININKMNCNKLLDLDYKFAKVVFTFGISFNAFQKLF
ncbi:39407_t:CDS:2 [Gigaspora margarita]|uniref:39407_t:CDS:1 n=1 Tax=Gigaspora margarita TaxID=4874 RepID=A0ABN7W639_GIGMA|nr:39407_t:CDS:2 [Gigaspora margarita]